MLRPLLLSLLFTFVAFPTRAEESITVTPTDTKDALINPAMGWTLHFYSNIPKNYGSRLAPSDTLNDFPGLSTVYLRIPWAFLEPVEGQFNWALLDTPAQRWIALGKRIALRLTCSENWMKFATPEWVKTAGANGTFYRYGGTGPPPQIATVGQVRCCGPRRRDWRDEPGAPWHGPFRDDTDRHRFLGIVATMCVVPGSFPPAEQRVEFSHCQDGFSFDHFGIV